MPGSYDYQSPYDIYVGYCREGKLAYQVCRDDGAVVFYPRVVAPGSGSANLEWRVSRGLGVVYATTTVHQPKAEPYNVALIELDEGFRMMSQVDDMPSDEVVVGLRVKLKMLPGDDKVAPYPVFVRAGEGAGA